MTQEIANALYQNRFEYVGFDRKCHKKRQIRLAWDGAYSEQRKIKKAVGMLVKAGYKTKEIMLFMQCNYREVGYEECCLKLDLCKVWGVQVCDCYFDGQVMPNVVPEFWDLREIKRFRRKVRKHNMLVNFGIDPEVTGK